MTFKHLLLNLMLMLSFLLSSCSNTGSTDDDFNDLKTQEIKKKKVMTNLSCPMDPKSFGQIFVKNIEPDLACLQLNLDTFVKFVRTDKPGYLSRKHLSLYIKKNLKSVDHKVMDTLNTVFDLNNLFFGSDKNYIHPKNVKKLVKIFKIFNIEAVDSKIFQYFTSTKKTSYATHLKHRSKIVKAMNRISKELLSKKFFVRDRDSLDKIDDLEKFFDRFDHGNKSELLEHIRMVLFTKKAFFGGAHNQLNYLDLEEMLTKMPSLTSVVFDMSKASLIKFKDLENGGPLLNFILNDVNILYKNMHFNKMPDETVTDLNKIKESINHFLPEYSNFLNYNKSILKIKTLFFGGADADPSWDLDSKEYRSYAKNASNFKAGEITNAVKHVRKILTQGIEFYRMYKFFDDKDRSKMGDHRISTTLPIMGVEIYDNVVSSLKNYDSLKTGEKLKRKDKKLKREAIDRKLKRLERDKRLGKLALIDFSEFSSSNSDLYMDNFSRIVSNYRFFKGKFESPYYSDDIKRNADAVFEISVIEYLAKVAFMEYGVRDESVVGKYKIDMDIFKRFLIDFSDFLEDNDVLLPGRAANTAETGTLMSTLFQYQSNGDGFIEVPEIVEFGVSILAGLEVAESFVDNVEVECDKDEFDRLNPTCFRENFHAGLTKERGNKKKKISSYLSRLNQFFDHATQDEKIAFVKETENFARLCTNFSDGREIPLVKNDMMAIFGGLLNVEQTMARFDHNRNNILDPHEVDEGYDIYKSAVYAILPTKGPEGSEEPMLTFLADEFYKYLMKHKRVLDIPMEGWFGQKKFGKNLKQTFSELTDFLKFWWFENKSVPADRITIGTILTTLSNFSPEATANPFPCDRLLVPLKLQEKCVANPSSHKKCDEILEYRSCQENEIENAWAEVAGTGKPPVFSGECLQRSWSFDAK